MLYRLSLYLLTYFLTYLPAAILTDATGEAIQLYVGSLHRWCRQEACMLGRARVMVTCMLQMQCQAKIAHSTILRYCL